MRAEFGVTKEQAWVITAFRPGDEPPQRNSRSFSWKIALPSSDPSLYNPAKFEIVYSVTLTLFLSCKEKETSLWERLGEGFLTGPTLSKILWSLGSLRMTEGEGLRVGMIESEGFRVAMTNKDCTLYNLDHNTK